MNPSTGAAADDDHKTSLMDKRQGINYKIRRNTFC